MSEMPFSQATPMASVAIGLSKPKFTPLSFAFTLDIAQEKVCGLGVHEDSELARMHAVFDTIRDNGWSVPHGRPGAFVSYCDASVNAERMAAKLCGSMVRPHAGEHAELMEHVTKSLESHLEWVSVRGTTYERLYSEAIVWAMQCSVSTDAALPRWDWWETEKHAGELPKFLAALELPVVNLASAQTGGRVEFEGMAYEHPWLAAFTAQALPYHNNYLACRFPRKEDELWLIDENGCFAAAKVAPEQVHAVQSDLRQESGYII